MKIYIQIITDDNVARADPAISDIPSPCRHQASMYKKVRDTKSIMLKDLGKKETKGMSFCSGTISLMGGKKDGHTIPKDICKKKERKIELTE